MDPETDDPDFTAPLWFAETVLGVAAVALLFLLGAAVLLSN